MKAEKLMGAAHPVTNRNYAYFITARIISQLGDHVYLYAICWYVLDITKTGIHMAGMLAANALVLMAAAPFGGIIADRLNKKKVMVISDITQGIVLLAFLPLIRLNLFPIGVIYAGTILLGLCGAAFTPAANAMVPYVCGETDLAKAVSGNQIAANACTVIGMVLGGLFYRTFGLFFIIAVNAASNIIAAVMESRIRMPFERKKYAAETAWTAAGEIRTFMADLTSGFRYVKSNGTVFPFLLVNTVFTLIALPIAMVCIPYMFNVILGATSFQAALPQAATWIGIIIGTVAASKNLSRHRPERLIAGGLLFCAVSNIFIVPLFKFRDVLGIGVLSAACSAVSLWVGTAASFFIIPLYVLFHERCEEAFRGRFWGLENSLRTGAMLGGYLLAGLIAGQVPLGYIFSGASAVLSALYLVVLRISKVKLLSSQG